MRIVDKKKRKSLPPEDDGEAVIEGDPQEDVIATIHVLKNKTEVKKRVVTRHNKETDEV